MELFFSEGVVSAVRTTPGVGDVWRSALLVLFLKSRNMAT